ncbi:MAG: glycosyltransferase [Caldilineaceae bacterium]
MWQGWIGIVLLLILGERLLKYLLVRRFFARSLPVSQRGKTAMISILQPILSGDPTLWHCLARNLSAQSNYEREFLWLVDENDPVAIEGCQQLIDHHPTINVRMLIYPPPPNGVNPKTFKLIAGLRQATGEWVAVLDDDTMLPDQAWEQALPYLEQPGVGLVFGLPYYVNFSNRWSALVAAFVNGFSLLTYVPYTFVHEPLTINGMFYLLKRSTLDAIGGFVGLETQLCDDYAVAQHLRTHGYQIVQTPLRHAISTQVGDWRHYLRIMTRWLIFPQVSVMRSAAWGEQWLFYLFAFVPTFVPLLLLILTLLQPTGIMLSILLGYCALSGTIAWDLNRRYLQRATPAWALPLLVLMYFLLPLHTLWALLAPRRINWRGHIMAVQKDGGFSFVERR